jgi:hypothetical protein
MRQHSFCRNIIIFMGLALLSGCNLFTSTTTTTLPQGPVQGKINSQPFSVVSAVAQASSSAPGAYQITLSGTNSLPQVQFTVAGLAQTYTVKTFGIQGLSVTAYLGEFSFVSFDSGTLTISKVDLQAGQIVGRFIQVTTNDGNSLLNGEFSATIQ